MIRKTMMAAVFAVSMLASAPILVHAQGAFTQTGNLNTPRSLHSATLLSDGKVLVAGGKSTNGSALSSAELYDPATGKWTTTGSMTTPRYSHSATLLSNGEVLVAGGILSLNESTGLYVCTATAEVYNPSTGKWTATGSLPETRCAHSAALLESGSVLSAGGGQANSPDTAAYLYSPATGTWAATGSTIDPTLSSGVAVLQNGEVLLVGAAANLTNSAELYLNGHWALTGNMEFTHSLAITLANGNVLAYGGRLASYVAEIYTTAAGSWKTTKNFGVSPPAGTLTLLQSGEVLEAAGANEYSLTTSSSLYNPATNAWTRGPNLINARKFHTATLLSNGQVLVVGGANNTSVAIASAEFYTP
jgi:N-acetylneuraminic acid mutarotase